MVRFRWEKLLGMESIRKPSCRDFRCPVMFKNRLLRNRTSRFNRKLKREVVK
jgi:hypothetical protein